METWKAAETIFNDKGNDDEYRQKLQGSIEAQPIRNVFGGI